MESFEKILSTGGHRNSLGRSSEVYDMVKTDLNKLDELFGCIYADDAWIRMRAIDTFEKLVKSNPNLALPYTDKLLEELTIKSQPSIQWHLAQLFAVIKLSSPQREKALAWLKGMISTTKVDWIVSANVMKTLFFFYENKLFSSEELNPLLKLQTEHESKTVRKKAEQFLNSIQKQQKFT